MPFTSGQSVYVYGYTYIYGLFAIKSEQQQKQLHQNDILDIENQTFPVYKST